ncbi:MAG: ribosomal L7Ae/L30e/S12e/Gadd45 family protein [Clostridiaceae bacterium]
MLDRLEGKKVVGLKQSLKAIKNGSGKTVYVAKDADIKIYDQIKSAAEENSLEIILVDTMKELGRLCGIDVGAATAVIINE